MLIHVVKSGESLWKIATYYHVTMAKVIEVNGLPNPNNLVIGQALVIPTEDIMYIVKPGESLWKIAQNYGTSIQSLMQNNQITNPERIYPGMQVMIPAIRYKVQRGESLFKIAQKYGVSLQDLLKVNDIKNANIVNPGTILVIPRKNRPVIDVNGYIYILGEQAVPIVREDGNHLTYLSPFAYRIKETGELEPIDDLPAISAGYEEKAVPMMCITNFTSTDLGQNLAHAVLSSPQVINTLLTNIISIMSTKKYQGLNIDFEGVLPADRELYNSFLQTAVNRLHPKGYFVSSALAPKTGSGQVGVLYEAHDYEAHGRILDFVILMTYEWGYRKGPPQAISPINQIEKVLDYAVSVIPRNKIFFGFQIYARDWLLPFVVGQEAETISNQEAIIRAAKYGTVIQFDPVAQSPFFLYTDTQGRMHEVWFEDARSAQAKFDMVKAYRLRGISYWALGYPYPENWTLLEDNFTVRKQG